MTIQDMVAIATAIAALISAVAAAFWGRGLAEAKDQTIVAKDAQIEMLRAAQEQMAIVKDAEIEMLQHEIASLKELNPSAIREYFVSVKQQLEEQIEYQKNTLEEAKLATKEKEAEIAKLISNGKSQAVEIEQLKDDRNMLITQRERLERRLSQLQTADSELGKLQTDRIWAIVDDVLDVTTPKVIGIVYATAKNSGLPRQPDSRNDSEEESQ